MMKNPNHFQLINVGKEGQKYRISRKAFSSYKDREYSQDNGVYQRQG